MKRDLPARGLKVDGNPRIRVLLKIGERKGVQKSKLSRARRQGCVGKLRMEFGARMGLRKIFRESYVSLRS